MFLKIKRDSDILLVIGVQHKSCVIHHEMEQRINFCIFVNLINIDWLQGSFNWEMNIQLIDTQMG